MSAQILVLLYHPAFERSKINRRLVAEISDHPNVEIRDLYECYPDFYIDVATEQACVAQFDTLIFLHPIYWYSCPALMKEWLDVVLSYNWAYGPQGRMLAGKSWLSAVTASGREEAYQTGDRHGYKVAELLRPFELTARLCRMQYLDPWIIHDAHHIPATTLNTLAERFRQRIDTILEQAHRD